MSRKRVVVTGMGAVTPFGVGVDAFWDGLIEGRSAVGYTTLFDTAEYDARIGGEVPGFDPADHLDKKLIKRLDRYAQFALVAADEAFKRSGLVLDLETPERISVIFGSGIGGMNEIEAQFVRLSEKGPGRVSAFTIPKLMVNAASGNISIQYRAKGKSIAVSTACASANNAMGEALSAIRKGDADIVFTGGAEAALTPLSVAAFSAMKALSTRNDEPKKASRPFDRDRDGFVLSEGAGAFVFEELEHARRRGAPILAEILGFASTSDADHLTQPPEDGRGAAAAMKCSLDDARLNPDQVDYINAHATATPLGDIAESVAVKSVFGSAARRVVVSSTKGAVGHLLGASGGVELVAVIRAIQNSVIPPTVNLENPGEGCDLDYCPGHARDARIRFALNNSFGFGGHNACLVVGRYEG